tara:strand:+ start:946 stop:1050 length:105 start_codon:yes stop_codon:yes gene_type:complete
MVNAERIRAMLVVVLFVVVWIPISVAACKWIADA